MKEYEYIREFGEGVDRMYRELEEGGWPMPLFRQDDFMLKSTLNANASSQSDASHNTSPKTSSKTSPKLLNNKERMVLSLIRDKNNITAQE